MNDDPNELMTAFADLVRLTSAEADVSESEIVIRFVGDHSLDRDDLLILSSWCGAIAFSDKGDGGGPFLGTQIRLGFVGAHLSERARRDPSATSEDLRDLFSSTSFSDFLDGEQSEPVDLSGIAPHACVSKRFRLTRPRSYPEAADAVEATLTFQGWTLTRREHNREVTGNVVPTEFVPEMLVAASGQNTMSVFIGWPDAAEALITIGR